MSNYVIFGKMSGAPKKFWVLPRLYRLWDFEKFRALINTVGPIRLFQAFPLHIYGLRRRKTWNTIFILLVLAPASGEVWIPMKNNQWKLSWEGHWKVVFQNALIWEKWAFHWYSTSSSINHIFLRYKKGNFPVTLSYNDLAY